MCCEFFFILGSISGYLFVAYTVKLCVILAVHNAVVICSYKLLLGRVVANYIFSDGEKCNLLNCF